MGIFSIYESLGPAGAASYLFWVVFAITFHELAHGWAALWMGDDTPRTQGRMTWNPVVHMGLTSLICLLIVGIAWGSMPTDPSKYRWGRSGRIVVSGAGPASNALLALVCWTVLGAMFGLGMLENYRPLETDPDSRLSNVANFLVLGGLLNGLLAFFNLLPLPPFDGASIVAGFSRTYYRWLHDPRIATVGFFIALVALFSGFGSLCSQASILVGFTWAKIVELGFESIRGVPALLAPVIGV
jgi:Zn-dependent protease